MGAAITEVSLAYESEALVERRPYVSRWWTCPRTALLPRGATASRRPLRGWTRLGRGDVRRRAL